MRQVLARIQAARFHIDWTRQGRRGWFALRRLMVRVSAHNLSVAAAGVGFYGMLAAFPALAALISLYGLYADPEDAVSQFAILRQVMPEQAYTLLMNQLRHIVQESHGSLGLGAVFGLLLALWSAGAGVRALMSSLNVVYGTAETRGLLRFYALSVGFTFAALCLGAFALTVIAAAPLVLNLVALGTLSEMLISFAPWPILAAMVMGVLCVLYRYGAARRPPSFRAVTVGAGSATLLWIAASILFSLYVSAFGNYNATYGALGSIVVLLLWFYISALLVLLGAELNEEIAAERRAAREARHSSS